jgi:hypothetical protein
MRLIATAIAVLCVFAPRVTTGQTSNSAPAPTDAESERRPQLSLQLAAGPTLIQRGNVLSAAFGYSPASLLELVLNVERNHLSFRLHPFNGGYSATRGGTMTFVSGELRLAFLPMDGVSPFAVAGVGGGVARPNVNAEFPDRVRNDVRVAYFGAGVQVPLRRRLSLFGDARIIIATENDESVSAVWPLRTGVAWRF